MHARYIFAVLQPLQPHPKEWQVDAEGFNALRQKWSYIVLLSDNVQWCSAFSLGGVERELRGIYNTHMGRTTVTHIWN